VLTGPTGVSQQGGQLWLRLAQGEGFRQCETTRSRLATLPKELLGGGREHPSDLVGVEL
jgi:hypothetical protein